MATSRTGLAAGQFDRIAKALADPRRFQILERIAAMAECPCRTIVEELPVAQATVSHHLKELVVAGLLTERQEGQAKFFCLRREVLTDYFAEAARRLRVVQS
jgi:ArsR family transcriptional regulator, arsenate/arsenite/antimonite-responsive transcriptional repressor